MSQGGMSMGHYEGWDGVWPSDAQVGWICPRCETFIPRGAEHDCEVTSPKIIESLDSVKNKEIRNG